MDGGEEGALSPVQKLLNFFRIKFRSDKLSLATGTTKKSLWGCVSIYTQSMGIGTGQLNEVDTSQVFARMVLSVH